MARVNHGGICFTLQGYAPAQEDQAEVLADGVLDLEEPVVEQDELWDLEEPLEVAPLDSFHVEIRKFPLLTPEEEKMLAKKIQEEGDREAFERFVLGNLRLVIACAKKAKERVGQDQSILSFMDLVQEGIIGLMIAVSRFDYKKGTRFSTYGVPWIYQRMKVALLQHRRGMSVPGYAGLSARAYAEQVRAFKSGERLELPDGVDLDRIRSLAVISDVALSIDFADGDEQGSFSVSPEALKGNSAVGYEETDPEEVLERTFFRDEFLSLLRKELSCDEYDILCRRFGLGNYTSPHKLSDIAEAYGKSSEYIRGVVNGVIKKLKESNLLKMFCQTWGVA
ncbi:putative RNA polymerase, sigma 70 family subunit [Thermovirga lienii DSM 17291]|jgi:RNA polymerase primary sigma factor|uniref:Putative RNA polymerase, sigma 70 family subunit n=1 Tax=Thermovirga lienii (strain ATCC BAA-1197 / DSM 17291 / Cas60314) TaxID=580340 RepID=G7V5W3_THELD|nr:sigma-70 family RNA polymerase sigma factor [Thermovirga lienii]AER65868.1 putative RNA polymerase, sigma 70 family subunit [Thermovirga lienii DSM 17291]KUK42487.1 MAG: RNA polymerase sigma factor [Thermovirga lienii]MDN5318999.1 polymerase primary sigma factor [Thermovirga sp.]MDN5368238.1 polymerase primary sigma factor [Thermovirga sp.]